MTKHDRRKILKLAASAAAVGPLSLAAGACARNAPAGAGADATPLKDLAAAKGLRFGSAMAAHQLSDPRYVEVIRRECGVIVAENEHKWYVIHPQSDQWNFQPADALVDFAKTEGLGMRGHTLLWHHPRWLPDWVNALEFDSAAQAEAMLGDYVTRVASRYHPFIYSWDVVNEAVDDKTGALRETAFSRAMGPEAIDFCFHKAKEAAPDATLAYNDYMSWESGNENHRKGVLKLLERLVKNGVPIDALGVQSHSNYDMPDAFTPEKQRAWREFVDEVVAMGLDVYLTEFDVNDTDLPPDVETRDRLMAGYAKDYLDMMLSYEQTKDLLVWGMVDSYSWLQDFLPREDGVPKRPTLYDAAYRPKPLREAVAAALRAAPAR
ncbi:endo-1,4-beta-xylanase [Amphiplicatus metriothermophilus]|uniref:Beta-xylanase n=1 Tax=Amphiplicatus metriothermophilus TaxID=1519374 RepID=A0A239PY59_9PROT|nr:endo-1,4-beta-xylanase [Amphiplicatus metriothermophilus]MBB5518986.1 endo-1,4-beta-xylanase [Amphiplicatus metriothermophilus]SNT74597.1 endo-1,4-beta-xylanase [Amphiplicatus metriothermophilus]